MIPAATRVLLVDDHALVRLGLARLIAAEPWLAVCGQAATTAAVAPLVRETDPDVIVLDLMLKDGSGFETMKALLAEFPHLQILILSMHDQRVYADRCIKAGARGYLMKDEVADLIVTALRRITEGGIFLSPSLGPDEQRSHSPLEQLSDREMRVFELIGEGLPTRDIAERLAINHKTVEAHKDHIKKKLGIAHAQDLANRATEWREKGI